MCLQKKKKKDYSNHLEDIVYETSKLSKIPKSATKYSKTYSLHSLFSETSEFQPRLS